MKYGVETVAYFDEVRALISFALKISYQPLFGTA